MENLLIPVLLLPLVGAMINGFAGKKLGDKVVSIVGIGAIAIPGLLAWLLLFELMGMDGEHGNHLSLTLFEWIHVGAFKADFGLWLDELSVVMLLIVTNIGALIHLYSVGYMKGDPSYWRFFAYLNLFIFSMLCLILGSNLLVLFLGWEGVGLCSYLLIGFWYENSDYAKAGKKAFVTNRVGDFGFALGMMLLFALFGTLEPSEINHALEHGLPTGMNPKMIEAAALLLFVGATGKSAQIPLFVWLPDAMAGPTPVSALIHAATMVTAGVYMIARLNGLFFHAEFAMHVVLVIGAATALLAATIGLVQNDIKKVLAYSTVSQLGFMFVAMGAGAWAVGIFHLMTHAFFKACLFLGSGSVILAMHHEQDMRFYGGLSKFMPKTYWTFFAATLAISGIFPFAGFFSKDEILWFAYASDRGHPVIYVVVLAAAICTAFYMFRIMWMTFWGEHRGVPEGHGDHDDHDDHSDHEGDHDDHHGGDPVESPWTMTVPLIVLGALSLVGGFLGVPHLLGNVAGHFPNLLHDWLHPVFQYSEVHYTHADGLEWGLMGLSLGLALSVWGVTAMLWRGKDKLTHPLDKVPAVHKLLWNKWYVDELYEVALIGPIVKFSREVLWKIVDEVCIDGTVNFVGGVCKTVADGLGRLQNGDVGNYATVMVGGMLFLLLCLAGYGLW
ncbi:MAG: NADH-quinone oxidoreductase subunit L [Proteobacteria bacterium]|nr:NADH-quinone oxidoreductase subunit L [Pseudomonadota bacterium]